MSMSAISSVEKIKVNLLKLKPREVLQDVYNHLKKRLEKYFDENGNPNKDYFEEVKCPVCNSDECERKMTIDKFDYRTCDHCKAVYNSPRLKSSVMNTMYKSGEYLTYFNKLTIPGQSIRKNHIDVRRFKQVSSFFDTSGTILDVGCGSGSFLKVCRENGWEVYGVDPSDSAGQVSREQYNIEIEQNPYEIPLKTLNSRNTTLF